MDTRNREVSISQLFEQFIEAATMRNVLNIHNRILHHADLRPCEFNAFFPRYKRTITSSKQRRNWKAKALFSKIDKRAAYKCYSNTKTPNTERGNKACDNSINSNSNDISDDKINSNYDNNNALQSYNCLIIGSGPAGLRTAIELQLLGASKVCIVEKRSRFSRNNVLHLWPFVIDDLKSLGAKKFYGKFCAGSIDHISIRQLQLILLKVCLMVGCDFRDSCSYEYLCPDSIKQPPVNAKSIDDTSSDNINNSFSDTSACNISSCKLDQQSGESVNDSSQSSCAPNNSKVIVDTNESQKKDSNAVSNSFDNDSSTHNHQNEKSSETQTTEVNNSAANHQKNTSYSPAKRPDNLRGSHTHFECDSRQQEKELHSYEWDIVIGADGRRNTLSKFFPRKEFRGRLAIAITANFINRQTQAETSVPEISGLSFIYNQDMFNALAFDTNIQLENICYYKDDTHYFVMTAKKKSLLERGVLINDHAVTQDLLSDNNVNKEALLKYARDAAYWTTGLEPLDFALNHYGQEDCAMFDFTSMYAASNACKALRTKGGGFTLVSLVGDSLLEPFWPTGSGCARGFLSSFDAAWMCRQWAVNKCATINYHGSTVMRSNRQRAGQPDQLKGENIAKMVISPTTHDRMALSVIAERESIYRILAQTTSENLQQNYSHWTLNPHTRYPNLNRHLVLPSQVEHLLSDGHTTRASLTDISNHRQSKMLDSHQRSARRVKSPNSLSPRKSPKKLKSADASPVALPKNLKNRSKSLSKYSQFSRSRQDLELVDSFLGFEESYRNLAESELNGTTPYLDFRTRDSTTLDDLFIPSLSGTLPSSNNLSHLEARRARDIDDCLRQRRQKSKINFVRDQLINQLRGETSTGENENHPISGGNAVLFNEIKRLREQQSTVDVRARPISGPLSLLNSMRRCASFAERVKSFENKLVQSNQDPLTADQSTMNIPKTPIDNVKNLPQFATLQELIINGSTKDSDVRKSSIPVMKLSKEDWNVKCWENKLKSSTASGPTISRGSSVPARSNFVKSMSEDAALHGINARPKKQVDMFQERIKEMAEKLKTSKEKNPSPYQSIERGSGPPSKPSINNSVRSQGWINHLKRELVKGSNDGSRMRLQQQPMNPVIPNKPIKKLFEDDDDDDDDGIDVDRHYDHLCINRPTNRYLSKGAYTGHLARSKYNNSTTTPKKINCPNPIADNKQAYLKAITSRGSSASSTLSDYSTNTVNSSSGGSDKRQNETKLSTISRVSTLLDVDCARCKKFVSTSDRITIGQSNLHRLCLTCSECGLTLRSNEIHLSLDSYSENQDRSFLCAICKPEIRNVLNRELDDRLVKVGADSTCGIDKQPFKACFKSREEFLGSQINYNELYRNILPADKHQDNSTIEVSPKPIQITLPLAVLDCNSPGLESIQSTDKYQAGIVDSLSRPAFRVANQETIDGKELVTLILPPSRSPSVLPDTLPIEDENNCGQTMVEREFLDEGGERDSRVKKGAEQQHNLIDEEELNRILHLDSKQNKTNLKLSDISSSTVDLSSSEAEDDEIESSGGSSSGKANKSNHSLEGSVPANSGSSDKGDDSSSLDIAPDSDEENEFGDDDKDVVEENADKNSTCNDFVSSEEFDDATQVSDKSGPQIGSCRY